MKLSGERFVAVFAVILAAVFITAGFLMFSLFGGEGGGDTGRESISAAEIHTGAITESEASSVSEKAYPIDINKATLSDFTGVNGIGEVTAGRIIDYRAEKGRIRDIGELLQIEGIGEDTCGLLEEYFYVSDSDKAPAQTTAETSQTTKHTTTAHKETKSKTTTTTAKRAEFPIDINKVTKDELTQIDGVGEGLADKITALRAEKGKITDMAQLLEIYGIGEATVDMLRGYLYVSEADFSAVTTTAASAAETSKVTSRTTVQTQKTQTTTVTEKQKHRVNINEADAAELANALLIESDAAELIVTLRGILGGYTNIYELLYLEDYDKRYGESFFNGVKDFVYV